jgi:sec-independent protein translocase protein TatB
MAFSDMPSLQDSAVIFFIALLLFGPKRLPELARYVGKLMNEFRRASSEFRMQMNDEFRQIEQADQQKKIAAMEAAAPLAPAITADIPDPEHPHLQLVESLETAATVEVTPEPPIGEVGPEPAAPESLPIASAGKLDMMPPATGLPVSRSHSSSLGSIFDAIPHTPDPVTVPQESETHG